MEPRMALYEALYDLVEAGPETRGSRASRVVECVESVIRDHLHDRNATKAEPAKATPEGPMFWLTREGEHLNGSNYELWEHKPIFIPHMGIWKGTPLWTNTFSPPGFPALEPGECRAFRLVPVEEGK